MSQYESHAQFIGGEERLTEASFEVCIDIRIVEVVPRVVDVPRYKATSTTS